MLTFSFLHAKNDKSRSMYFETLMTLQHPTAFTHICRYSSCTTGSNILCRTLCRITTSHAVIFCLLLLLTPNWRRVIFLLKIGLQLLGKLLKLRQVMSLRLTLLNLKILSVFLITYVLFMGFEFWMVLIGSKSQMTYFEFVPFFFPNRRHKS